MSAHVAEFFWRWSCLFGKIAPLLGLSSGGGSGQDGGLAGKRGYRRNSSRAPAPPSQSGSRLGADEPVTDRSAVVPQQTFGQKEQKPNCVSAVQKKDPTITFKSLNVVTHTHLPCHLLVSETSAGVQSIGPPVG